ncbi:MAG: hypothetical protein QNJ05_14975 [Woeseiaceae bacterium]|nr:hypothetical protein [Woeseiaceae bacterium]
MIYYGSCHCGSIKAEYETEKPVQLRQDGCGFCSSRGVKSASDPDGKLQIVSERPLTRYQFGHRTADFLICSTCGTYAAAITEGPRGQVAVINVVGLNIPGLTDEPVDFASLEGESVEDRMQRRLARWTPVTLSEAELG